jgi:putative GTP pyrophosphokinase
MAFPSSPNESKNKINKAGKILAKRKIDDVKELIGAIDLVGRWRACHMYPINTFRSTLSRKLKDNKEAIVAQRLKRMPTIIDKLRRYPNMQLSTMQDIGGVRAVVGTLEDVYKLAKEYQDKTRFKHILVNEKDYIRNPRDEDGYRSLHLIYKYQNKQAPQYNNLLVELQIRTRLQHTWATAVETMGTILGQALKSRQGNREWINFFAVTSSAFAYLEKSTLVPRFNKMTRDETFRSVANAEVELKALEKMRGFSVAVNAIGNKKKNGKEQKYHFHLIILNSLKHTVQIKPFKREDFKKAVAAYEAAENDVALNNAKIEPVLVSAGPLVTLRKAYPNFFLDITGFITTVHRIISLINNRKL